MSQGVETVMAWHEAVNAGDAGRTVALADADVEMGGPRGTVRGVTMLREWAEQSGIQLQPQRIFARDGRVVVEQIVTWRVAETGEMTAPDTVATAFVVTDGLIQEIIRYPSLSDALDATGLEMEDETPS